MTTGTGKGRPDRKAAGKQPKQPKPPREPSSLDLLKLQIAEELGLGDKVRHQGWAMLTAAETGRVGGLLGRRLREQGLVVGPKGTLLRAGGSVGS